MDKTLGELRRGGYLPQAWLRFWRRSWRRSVEQARARPRAAARVNLLHFMLLLGGRPLWVGCSWLLAWSHLGLLEPATRGLGAANTLTLIRANLPAAGWRLGRWTAPVAIALDLLDGQCARHLGGETPFGAYADGLADIAFWSWYASRFESNPVLRGLAALSWVGPAAGLGAAYFIRGRSTDLPRPHAGRYLSVALQGMLTLRSLAR